MAASHGSLRQAIKTINDIVKHPVFWKMESGCASSMGASAWVCVLACKHICLFTCLTESYRITQALKEKWGGVAISLPAESIAASYEACLRFSHAVITYVVFCFLFPAKRGT